MFHGTSTLGERLFKLSNALFSYHLTPIQFTVYSFLMSSAGQKGKCWPAMKTIAANCHCSETAAREAIAALEQKGFIRRVKRYQDRPNGSVRQTSNAYYIQEQPPLPASWGHTPAGGGGVMYEQDKRVSAPMIKCKKTPRKKCNFVAEVKEKG